MHSRKSSSWRRTSRVKKPFQKILKVSSETESDATKLLFLVEENGRLNTQVNTLQSQLQIAQTQLMTIEASYKKTHNILEAKRERCRADLRNLERRLQETQDMLLIKLKELHDTQQATEPLRAEIEMLKILIDEEKLAEYDSDFGPNLSKPIGGSYRLAITHNRSHRQKQNQQLERAGTSQTKCQTQSNPQVSRGISPISNSLHSLTNLPRRPSSVPLATKGFMRGPPGSSGIRLFESPLAESSNNLASSSCNFLSEHDINNPSMASSSSKSSKLGEDSSEEDDEIVAVSRLIRNERRNSEARRGSGVPDISHLPPRPDNPNPPKKLPRRPASALETRFIPADAGQGRDYFDAMFNDLRKNSSMSTRLSSYSSTGSNTTLTSTSHCDANNPRACSIGNVKVIETDKAGNFIRVQNTSSSSSENIGGFSLQQNISGSLTVVFRFPLRSKLQPGQTATIWSADCKDCVQEPPYNYVSKQLRKWETESKSTTILCKPNGQAVAWITLASESRTSRNHSPEVRIQSANSTQPPTGMNLQKNAYEKMLERNQNKMLKQIANSFGGTTLPCPTSYHSGPQLASNTCDKTLKSPAFKREKVSHTVPQILVSRPESSPSVKHVGISQPFHRHIPENSSLPVSQHHREPVKKNEGIVFTPQKTTRSNYDFEV